MNIDYIANFNNKFYAPIGYFINNINSINNLNIETALELDCYYDESLNLYKLYDNIFNYFDFYYNQPVYYGIFNYIKNIHYINNSYYIELVINDHIHAQNLKMIFSPKTIYSYYSWYKFKYNYSLHIDEPNINTSINVMQYIIDPFQLNEAEIKYGTPINDNNIYFYTNQLIDNTTGKIIQNPITYDSYHLLLEIRQDYNFVHLVKIIYPNKLYIFSIQPIILTSVFYLDKLILIHINVQNEFTFGNQIIQVTNPLLAVNENKIDILNKYSVKYIRNPVYINNHYEQLISVNPPINLNNYDVIYLNPTDSKSYNIIANNANYIIISDICLGTDITTIYTKNKLY